MSERHVRLQAVTETELRTMRESWAVLTRQVCGVVYSGLDIALKSAWAEAEISQQNTEEAPLPLIMVTAVTVQHCSDGKTPIMSTELVVRLLQSWESCCVWSE